MRTLAQTHTCTLTHTCTHSHPLTRSLLVQCCVSPQAYKDAITWVSAGVGTAGVAIANADLAAAAALRARGRLCQLVGERSPYFCTVLCLVYVLVLCADALIFCSVFLDVSFHVLCADASNLLHCVVSRTFPPFIFPRFMCGAINLPPALCFMMSLRLFSSRFPFCF
jgi:hypothetical protein